MYQNVLMIAATGQDENLCSEKIKQISKIQNRAEFEQLFKDEIAKI